MYMDNLKNKKIYVWGASNYLKDLLDNNKLSNIKLDGIIDNDISKDGQFFCDLPIYHSEKLKKLNPDLILATVPNCANIIIDIKKKINYLQLNSEVKDISEILLKPYNMSFFECVKFRYCKNKSKLNQIMSIIQRELPNIYTVYSMLSVKEKYLLYYLAKYYYSGEGKIFDAGIFLGGCTEAFLKGLILNKKQKDVKKAIWAYEYGNATDLYNERLLYNVYNIEPNQNDFTNITFTNLNDLKYPDKIKFIQGDILKQDYPDKIEIMFLDVCKTPEINFRIQQLFSRMIPGKSVLIQQDYIYENLPYIKITMGYLRDYFEYIGSIGCSVVFLLKKEIPMNILNINPCKIYPKEKLIELHNYYNKYLNEAQKIRVLESEYKI